MPPKGTKKPKALEPATPKPKAKATEPTSTSKPRATPRSSKPKEAIIFTTVDRDAGAALPIDVNFEGKSVQAKMMKNGAYGAYGHSLNLASPNAFSVAKTIVLTEGEYEGYQAILIRPSKALPFMRLPKELRNRIYNYYFAPKGVTDTEIVLEARRSNKEVYAKIYAEGSKTRVGLLATSKEIYDEAAPILYDYTLKFETTTTLLDFLSQTPETVRPLLTKLSVKGFVKTTSRNALHQLATAPNVARLHFDHGVFSEGDPGKAAKKFYEDAYKFLEAVGGRKGDKTAGVDVLSFGRQALTCKDDKNNAVPWSKEMLDEFRKILKGKLK